MNRRTSHAVIALITCAFLSACERDATSRQSGDSAGSQSPAAANVIDSALPREVELARFRADLGPAPTELEGGLASRDAVVNAYVKRLAARDTAGLIAISLSKPEFAWLYYPTNPIGKPPYDLSPGLMWFQFDGNSRKGLFHALDERGGKDLKVVGYKCAAEEQQGENHVYLQCALRRIQAPGDTLSEVLFGGIVERHGRFKLIGFTNKL